MKRILCLVFALIVVNSVESQVWSTDKLWVTFADTTTQVLGGNATSKTEINKIFNEYEVTSVAPLFPFAKTPLLRHTYEVTTNNATSLYERISKENDLFFFM